MTECPELTLRRLFQGVQGDKTRQGELFGIKNILTLRKDLSTKEQIEKAYVGDLSWALAHTDDPEEVRYARHFLSIYPIAPTGRKPVICIPLK